MRCPTLFFLVLLPSLSFGQIKINAQDIPKIGDEVFYSTSSTSIDYESTGPNYRWNFSDLESATNDTFRFISPPGVYALAFLGNTALEVVTSGQKQYQFFKGSTGGWAQTGVGAKLPVIGIDMPLRFDNADQVYKFPLTYGDSYSDTFGGATMIQNIRIAVHGHRTTEVDGWGKITTPFGSFDCIRVKSEITEIDTVLIGFDNSRIEYSWLAKGQKIPILTVTVPMSTQSPLIMYRDSSRNRPNGIGEIGSPKLSLYPNPAVDKVTIGLPSHLPGDAVITLYNTAGQHVFREIFSGAHEHLILDLSSLKGGLYLMKLEAGSKQYFQKVSVVR